MISGSQNESAISRDSFATLMSMAERGVLKPVIDSVVPFTNIVDAHRRVDTGRKVGSVVLTHTRDC